MKHKFLLKTTLLLFALVAGSTSAWGDAITINIGSFTGLPSGTASYDTYIWSEGGISGKATIYANQNSTSMQFNATNKYLYSTSAIDGRITSIVMTTASGTNRTYAVYGSNTAYSGSGESYGTLIGSKTVTTSATTFEVTSGDYKYFTIVKSGSGAGYLSSVVVNYETVTKVVTPVISGDTKFLGSTEVTIDCSTEGAAIQYTTDNGENWTNYSDPFDITETTTVKAKATKDGLTNSDVSDAMTFTKVTPMTVAAAKTYIDAGVDLDDQFVSGIVSQVDGISSNAITYWISDDGTTTGQMEVYKGKGLNGADFSDVTDLEVGDRVGALF